MNGVALHAAGRGMERTKPKLTGAGGVARGFPEMSCQKQIRALKNAMEKRPLSEHGVTLLFFWDQGFALFVFDDVCLYELVC